MNDINAVKSCFRRERPESLLSMAKNFTTIIMLILLFPLFLVAAGSRQACKFILRIARKFTGKEREK